MAGARTTKLDVATIEGREIPQTWPHHQRWRTADTPGSAGGGVGNGAVGACGPTWAAVDPLG
jgi:hypothetical protein